MTTAGDCRAVRRTESETRDKRTSQGVGRASFTRANYTARHTQLPARKDPGPVGDAARKQIRTTSVRFVNGTGRDPSSIFECTRTNELMAKQDSSQKTPHLKLACHVLGVVIELAIPACYPGSKEARLLRGSCDAGERSPNRLGDAAKRRLVLQTGPRRNVFDRACKGQIAMCEPRVSPSWKRCPA